MAAVSFEKIVSLYYEALYRFAYSLSGQESEAWDLTQQTFLIWARRGHQLRDTARVKTWLFTTLYREFLGARRKNTRMSLMDNEALELFESPGDAVVPENLDASTVLIALDQIDGPYRAAVVLFYLEEHSYREIAEILEVPIGTVMSRLSRGKAQLRQVLEETRSGSSKIIPFQSSNHSSNSKSAGHE